MNILLLGYGKMGKTIDGIAQERGHQVVARIDFNNKDELSTLDAKQVDVCIEFSQPSAAYDNIKFCLENGIPVITGTTGWLDKKAEIEQLCQDRQGTFLYASNFSIGVNIFFKLNSYLAQIMNQYKAYDVTMEEVHHTEKKDAPSGTAITLAEGVIDQIDEKEAWVNQETDKEQEVGIVSKREEGVPGTHTIVYRSDVDDIEIKHTAHTRLGFALGAVLVAEWIKDKKGVLTMKDFLKL